MSSSTTTVSSQRSLLSFLVPSWAIQPSWPLLGSRVVITVTLTTPQLSLNDFRAPDPRGSETPTSWFLQNTYDVVFWGNCTLSCYWDGLKVHSGIFVFLVLTYYIYINSLCICFTDDYTLLITVHQWLLYFKVVLAGPKIPGSHFLS